MPIPKKIDPPDDEGGGEQRSLFAPFAEFAEVGITAAFKFASNVFAPVDLQPSPKREAEPPEVPRVGEFYVDYSDITPGEIADTDAECEALFARSKPSSR